jgi:divalent metal cation (Fe/Co/Zn/Cd) transporter
MRGLSLRHVFHTKSPTISHNRHRLIRQAFVLEWVTITWMVVETAVALLSGALAHSIVLLAFGFDSLIELASAVVLLWRLNVELRQGQSFAENAEKMASRIGGILLFVLTAYVVAASAWKLWSQQAADFSLPGLMVSALAIPIMYVLSRRKLELAQQLGSRALRTDAIESITCGWLAAVVVVALGAQLLIGAWWIDPVASVAIVWFLFREGREAWEGKECCGHD